MTIHRPRAIHSPVFWVLSISLSVAVAANWNSEVIQRASGLGSEALAAASAAEASGASTLLREDSSLSQVVGTMVVSGPRIEFREDGTQRTFKCLENLWLERILEAQKHSEKNVLWVVDGRVTEFGQENYLMVEAAMKSR